MNTTYFSTKWFLIYYPFLGCLFGITGLFFLLKTGSVKDRMAEMLINEHPPRAVITFLKYFFLFTLPSLVLSFIPFSWIELMFSIWCLVVIYLIGIRLVRWEQTQLYFQDNRKRFESLIRKTGATMVSVALVMFLLGYLTMNRLFISS